MLTLTGRIFVIISLLGVLAPVGAAAQQRIGSFILQSQRDPLTDQSTSFAATMAADAPGVALLAACKDGRTTLKLGGVFLGGEESRIIWRFDGGAPQEARWIVGTRGNNARLPDGLVPEFLANMRRMQRVVVRAYDYKRSATTVTFHLSGATAALSRLSCR